MYFVHMMRITRNCLVYFTNGEENTGEFPKVTKSSFRKRNGIRYNNNITTEHVGSDDEVNFHHSLLPCSTNQVGTSIREAFLIIYRNQLNKKIKVLTCLMWALDTVDFFEVSQFVNGQKGEKTSELFLSYKWWKAKDGRCSLQIVVIEFAHCKSFEYDGNGY